MDKTSPELWNEYKHLMACLYFEAFHCSVTCKSWLTCEIQTVFNAENIIFSKRCALERCRLFVPAAPRRSSQRIRPGCRAAARGGSSHGPERLRWMATASCGSVLGSGEVNISGSRKRICTHAKGFWNICRYWLMMMLFQMHVAELLVSHGASLNAKTFLDETPIGTCAPQQSDQLHVVGGSWENTFFRVVRVKRWS